MYLSRLEKQMRVMVINWVYHGGEGKHILMKLINYAVKFYETGLFQYYQGVIRALFPGKPPVSAYFSSIFIKFCVIFSPYFDIFGEVSFFLVLYYHPWYHLYFRERLLKWRRCHHDKENGSFSTHFFKFVGNYCTQCIINTQKGSKIILLHQYLTIGRWDGWNWGDINGWIIFICMGKNKNSMYIKENNNNNAHL